MKTAAFGLVIFLAGLAAAQPAAPLAFDVADVHANPSVSRFSDGGYLPGGRVQLRGATIVDLVKIAWSVDGESVFGGPSWADSDRFDVIAKASPTSTEAERTLMLRALLADRFKLAVHEDKKELMVYAFTVGKKGPQFKETEGGSTGCKNDFQPGPPALIVAECRNMTVKQFGDQLHQMANAYLDHQVADFTELKGSYDITIKWSPRGALRANGEPTQSISVFEAVEKLGLKLELSKRSVPVIVIDSANRTPTENAPGVSKNLPPATLEFEAAEIKQNKSGAQMRRIQPKPGGRIEVENIPLNQLIALAWDFDDDRLIGLPKWAEQDAFDVVGKTAILPGEAPPPFDNVRLMLRALLIERFNMKVHNEDQPVAVWTLTAGKRGVKLKEADPASRAGCKRGTTDTGGSNPTPMITYTCTNTTMAQLADAMHQIAPGYVDHVAVDKTEIKGGYDFMISWTPRGIVDGGGGRDGRGGDPSIGASDPSGGQTFFQAVERQLGLKLEGGQKRAMPVLVFDHIEKLNAEN